MCILRERKQKTMLSPFRVHQNNINLQTQIELKQNIAKPFFATQNTIGSVISEYNVFPFNRWYKGNAYSTEPIVDDRNAGWRVAKHPKMESPNVYPFTQKTTFEPPCTTQFPIENESHMPRNVFIGASV